MEINGHIERPELHYANLKRNLELNRKISSFALSVVQREFSEF